MRAVGFPGVVLVAFAVSPSCGPPATLADEDEGWVAFGAGDVPPAPPVKEPPEAEVRAALDPLAPPSARLGPPSVRDREEFKRRLDQQHAVESLGWEYLKARQYRAARLCFTQWEPVSDCGTCAIGLNQEREFLIRHCRLHTGEQVAVAAELLRAVQGSGFIDTEGVAILFRLYQEAGQINDLLRLLDNSEPSKKNANVRDMLRVRRLAEAGDTATLIKLCQDAGHEPIECGRRFHSKGFLAADALAGMPGRDVKPVLAALGPPHSGASPWLLYVLGKRATPAGLKWLTASAMLDDHQGDFWTIAYAIALQGTPGSRVLSELAGRADLHDVSRRAAEWFRCARHPAPLEWPWPRPAPGSLPTLQPPP